MRAEGHGASLRYELEPLKLHDRRQHQSRRGRDRMGHQRVQIRLSGPAPARSACASSALPDGRAELVVEDDGVGRDDGGAAQGHRTRHADRQGDGRHDGRGHRYLAAPARHRPRGWLSRCRRRNVRSGLPHVAMTVPAVRNAQ